jgi:hypothetical protein
VGCPLASIPGAKACLRNRTLPKGLLAYSASVNSGELPDALKAIKQKKQTTHFIEVL